MAVYTALDPEVLSTWLDARGVGGLVDCRGIESGIENSNFFVTTEDRAGRRDFVLTLFERLDLDEVRYYLSLMQHLSRQDVPCPAPQADRRGGLCSMLAGKPAALVTRLAGRSVDRPQPVHCAAVGDVLARMHRAAVGFHEQQPNPRGIDWWIDAAARVRGYVDDDRRALLDDEIALQARTWRAVTERLPRGAIHADLFRDNVLFVDGAGSPALRGVIDFYFAGDDAWVLDLAICINDWCVDLDSGALDAARRDALLDAYEAARPLTALERDALPLALRAGALRFWLSRLDDLHRPRPAQMLKPHDPTRFERTLLQRRADAQAHLSGT